MAFGFGFALTAIAKAVGFTPRSLFTSGEQGVWYDPSDFSTMFQDAAGTIPVTAVEQPVGLMKDKSGRGNHATQATTTSRPVLSARVNLLTKTEQFDDAAWVKSRITLQTGVSDPDGGNSAFSFYETTDNGSHILSNLISIPSGVRSKCRVYLKYAGVRYVLLSSFADVSDRNICVDLVSNTIAAQGGLVNNASISQDKNGWYLVEFEVTAVSTLGLDIRTLQTVSTSPQAFVGDPLRGVMVWHPDTRVANESASLPAYQRVNTAKDYDTAGFPYYLSFDGVDDWLVTPSIDFTGTDKMTVFTADHSVYDNPTDPRAIVGLSTSTSGHNGTWWLTAYDLSYNATSLAYLRGNQPCIAAYGPDQRSLGYRTLVRAVRFDISKDLVSDEVQVRTNGVRQEIKVVIGPSAGSGAFGNYPLYIGAVGTRYLFKGNLYGLIVRGAQTDDDHLTHAEKYLAYKSGVTL